MDWRSACPARNWRAATCPTQDCCCANTGAFSAAQSTSERLACCGINTVPGDTVSASTHAGPQAWMVMGRNTVHCTAPCTQRSPRRVRPHKRVPAGRKGSTRAHGAKRKRGSSCPTCTSMRSAALSACAACKASSSQRRVTLPMSSTPSAGAVATVADAFCACAGTPTPRPSTHPANKPSAAPVRTRATTREKERGARKEVIRGAFAAHQGRERQSQGLHSRRNTPRQPDKQSHQSSAL